MIVNDTESASRQLSGQVCVLGCVHTQIAVPLTRTLDCFSAAAVLDLLEMQAHHLVASINKAPIGLLIKNSFSSSSHFIHRSPDFNQIGIRSLSHFWRDSVSTWHLPKTRSGVHTGQAFFSSLPPGPDRSSSYKCHRFFSMLSNIHRLCLKNIVSLDSGPQESLRVFVYHCNWGSTPFHSFWGCFSPS